MYFAILRLKKELLGPKASAHRWSKGTPLDPQHTAEEKTGKV